MTTMLLLLYLVPAGIPLYSNFIEAHYKDKCAEQDMIFESINGKYYCIDKHDTKHLAEW